MADIFIPPAALKAGTDIIRDYRKAGVTSDRIARAAIAAALNAWPGMEQDQLFHGFTDGTHYFQPRIILPMPQEASDE